MRGRDCDPGDCLWRGSRHLSGGLGSCVFACRSVKVGSTSLAPRKIIGHGCLPSWGHSEASRSKMVSIFPSQAPRGFLGSLCTASSSPVPASLSPFVYAFLFSPNESRQKFTSLINLSKEPTLGILKLPFFFFFFLPSLTFTFTFPFFGSILFF